MTDQSWSLFISPEAAKKDLLCPIARTFGGEPLKGHCRGPECALWRWKPAMASDPEFKSAIVREIAFLAEEREEKTGKPASKDLLHNEAVKRVMRNPEGHGIVREEGYCGLGGLPQ